MAKKKGKGTSTPAPQDDRTQGHFQAAPGTIQGNPNGPERESGAVVSPENDNAFQAREALAAQHDESRAPDFGLTPEQLAETQRTGRFPDGLVPGTDTDPDRPKAVQTDEQLDTMKLELLELYPELPTDILDRIEGAETEAQLSEIETTIEGLGMPQSAEAQVEQATDLSQMVTINIGGTPKTVTLGELVKGYAPGSGEQGGQPDAGRQPTTTTDPMVSRLMQEFQGLKTLIEQKGMLQPAPGRVAAATQEHGARTVEVPVPQFTLDEVRDWNRQIQTGESEDGEQALLEMLTENNKRWGEYVNQLLDAGRGQGEVLTVEDVERHTINALNMARINDQIRMPMEEGGFGDLFQSPVKQVNDAIWDAMSGEVDRLVSEEGRSYTDWSTYQEAGETMRVRLAGQAMTRRPGPGSGTPGGNGEGIVVTEDAAKRLRAVLEARRQAKRDMDIVTTGLSARVTRRPTAEENEPKTEEEGRMQGVQDIMRGRGQQPQA